MAKITYTDNLFVTVMLRGKSLLNVRLTGFDSLKELFAHIRRELAAYTGQLLTLQLRNSTQGWSRTDSLLFAA